MVNTAENPEAVDLALLHSPATARLSSSTQLDATSTTHPTRVSIYDLDQNSSSRLHALLNEFADVFQDIGFADLPQDQWIRIHLKPD